ncbi:MAG: hypothetical protein U0075_13605 [Thermomicrobiales bacterium]
MLARAEQALGDEQAADHALTAALGLYRTIGHASRVGDRDESIRPVGP